MRDKRDGVDLKCMATLTIYIYNLQSNFKKFQFGFSFDTWIQLTLVTNSNYMSINLSHKFYVADDKDLICVMII